MLQDKVIGIYCLTDDVLKGIGHREHQERKVSIKNTALHLCLSVENNRLKQET
jgi:hypothetical protein